MSQQWPALPYDSWKDTCETLHLWTQIVGKVKLALNPEENHWWHVPLTVATRGLTTGPIPCNGRLDRIFEVRFDFIDHSLLIHVSDGSNKAIPLVPRSVAQFYREPDYLRSGRATRFIGKCSPVHFFWGSFDLASSFFSGRRASERKGADRMTREGCSHEVISCGFWPGGGIIQEPAFYAYVSPEPPGLKSAPILPSVAFYHPQLCEFLLRCDDMRTVDNPEQALLDFCRSTYEASANLAKWDRGALEKPIRGAQ